MKAIFNIPLTSIRFNYTVLLTLTSIVCLASMQVMGASANIPIATAATLLVFSSRQPFPSTRDLLMRLYLLRISPPNRWRN